MFLCFCVCCLLPATSEITCPHSMANDIKFKHGIRKYVGAFTKKHLDSMIGHGRQEEDHNKTQSNPTENLNMFGRHARQPMCWHHGLLLIDFPIQAILFASVILAIMSGIMMPEEI